MLKINLYPILEKIEKLKLQKIISLLKEKKNVIEIIKKEKLILINYKNEYVNSFKLKKNKGINEIEWKNYDSFLNLIDKNIIVKEKIFEEKEKEIKKIFFSFKNNFKKMNVYNCLKSIVYKQEKTKEQFLNQRILDELMILFCLK
ncbi:MAG: flagellar FliJ family protein [Buchnera aphidicola (Tetraneura sorini)]